MTNFDSWVVSARQRDTKKIRFDGSDEVLEEKDSDGNVIVSHQPARRAWPEDAYVIIKSEVAGGDQEAITHEVYKSEATVGASGSVTQQNRILVEKAALASAAVMVTGFEGKVFTDKDTGKLLEMRGSVQQRMDTLRRLPQVILEFIQSEVNKLDDDPLALTPQLEESGSKNESKRVSTKS